MHWSQVPLFCYHISEQSRKKEQQPSHACGWLLYNEKTHVKCRITLCRQSNPVVNPCDPDQLVHQRKTSLQVAMHVLQHFGHEGKIIQTQRMYIELFTIRFSERSQIDLKWYPYVFAGP